MEHDILKVAFLSKRLSGGFWVGEKVYVIILYVYYIDKYIVYIYICIHMYLNVPKVGRWRTQRLEDMFRFFHNFSEAALGFVIRVDNGH